MIIISAPIVSDMCHGNPHQESFFQKLARGARKSDFHERLSRHYNRLCEKADEAGIDSAASVDLIQGAGIIKTPVTTWSLP